MTRPARRSPSRWSSPLLLLALVSLPACQLLVDVPVPRPLPSPAGAPAPLSTSELFRFALANLGEVSPGLLYRSRQPGRRLLEFLVRRVRLGHVINLRLGTEEEEREILRSLGVGLTHLPMHASRPPEPRQILEMIRVTHKARAAGHSVLIHCRAGADRAGAMVAIWRLLFQGVTDLEELERETHLHGHVSLFLPNVHRTIRRFRPELFRPFVDDPQLLDDPRAVADLESRYHQRQPLLSGSTRVERGRLRAGVGRVDLLEGWKGPIPMATYGPLPDPARGVREPVYARALVLDNGPLRLGIVSCDLLIADAELRAEVFRRVEARQLDLDDILLAATHTHTSVGGYVDHWLAEFYMMGKFQGAMRDRLARSIADALARAVADLRPARLGAGRAFVERLSRNRRVGGTVDPEVGIIKLEDTDGLPLAVVTSFTGHPILDPSDGLISPDYPGLLTRRLDERFGFGLFLQGALGNVNASPGGGAVWRSEGLAEKVAEGLLAAVNGNIGGIATREEVELGSMTELMDLPPFNFNLIPDILFPLEWLLAPLVNWPRDAPLQALRIGDVAIVACATEIGVRLGRQIKRRSPAPFPLAITHANAYAGYAVTQVLHARCKVDPTSVLSNNGSTHGARVVERACDLLEVQWGERLDPDADLLSPAMAERLEEVTAGLTPEERAARRGEAVAAEERELRVRDDPTLPETRRPSGGVSDSIPERVRLEFGYEYVDDLRGGDGVEGRRRDLEGRLRLRWPGDLRTELRLGYRRSDWELSDGRDGDEGATDLALGLERPFRVIGSRLDGDALRLVPRIAVTAPTGDADRNAPFAFAAGAGVWRPSAGGAVEFTWASYRTLSLRSLYTTAIDRHQGRRPGDRWESSLGYTERHGVVSLSLDLNAAYQLRDRRHGGRREVDVDDRSFSLGLRPGLSVHVGEHVQIFARGRFPLARSGRGASEGVGILGGVVLGF